MMYYLETGSGDPSYNLAFEETVLTRRREGNYLMLWQNDAAVIIGQNQNAEAEIDHAFVEAHGIRVVRRSTGGGAVYHDRGNLNYSIITDAGEAERMTMERFVRPVVGALRGLGLDAVASGRNDITVGGQKVSGTAQRVMGGRILFHGCLLFDADTEMAAGALRADPEKFSSKGTRSVRSRIGNIRPMLSRDMTMPQFWNYLKNALAADGLEETMLTAEELADVRTLCAEKYGAWEWNFGRSPRYDLTNKRRFAGGTLEVRAQVEDGRISDVVFYGDFLSTVPLDRLREAMRGCPYHRDDAAAVLAKFRQQELFGAITAGEVLDTLFYPNDKAGQ